MIRKIFCIFIILCLPAGVIYAQRGCDGANDSVKRSRERLTRANDRNDLDDILQLLKTAIDLCPSNGDAWYYRYLCEKELGNQRLAEYSLGKAKSLQSEALKQGDNPLSGKMTVPDKQVSEAPRNSSPSQESKNQSDLLKSTLSSNPNISKPLSISQKSQEKRVALVIGNGNYQGGFLRNPTNDARDVAEALRKVGFEVVCRENITKKEMEEEIRSFGKKLKGETVGLFYFAGHGVQINERNYLIPIGANIEKEPDIEYEAVDAGRVLGEMEESKNILNVLILDACRDNPFASGARSASRGLAIMQSKGSGTLIAYSTSPGMVSSDGQGRNGLYTEELLRYIRMPGLKIEDIFKQVRVAVKQKSKGKQIPWEVSSLEGDFFFNKQ
jgi:hypothetical protein